MTFGAEVVVDDGLRLDDGGRGKRDAVAAMDGLGESAVCRERLQNRKPAMRASTNPLPDRIRGTLAGAGGSEVTPLAPHVGACIAARRTQPR